MKTEAEQQSYIPALGFTVLTPLYDRVVKWTTRETAFKAKLTEDVNISSAGRVLDLACGTATLTIALQRRFPRAAIYGLDGDEKILRIARRKAQEANAKINFIEGFSTALPFSESYFEGVVSSLFFHHLTPVNKSKTLLELCRVLKPGGALHLADWGKPAGFLMSIASQPVQWLDGATTKDSFRGELPELIKNAGFSGVTETSHFNTFFGTLRLLRAVKNSTL